MHSRIIQLEKKPVPENERFGTWDIVNDLWFLHTVADSVTEDDDRDDSLARFKIVLSRGEPYIKYF